jgi:hypothetical protein
MEANWTSSFPPHQHLHLCAYISFPLTGGLFGTFAKTAGNENISLIGWREIIETMDWGLTYNFRDNLLSFCKRNLALFFSLSHLFCSFRLRLFCFVGNLQ